MAREEMQSYAEGSEECEIHVDSAWKHFWGEFIRVVRRSFFPFPSSPTVNIITPQVENL